VAIRTVFDDDQTVYRAHLRNKLEREPDICVATYGLEAIDQGRRLAPDVIIMDVMMPEINGIKTTQQTINFPSVKVLGLSPQDHRQIVDAVRSARASAYVLKENTFSE
jgi:DNA-binding NarL/FixJ family response regulator